MNAPVDPGSVHRLHVLDEHGARLMVQPGDVRGRFHTARTVVFVVLLAGFFALPWLRIGGGPAVLLDVPARRFTLFGATFGATDVPLLFFLVTGVAFALIIGSALAGRAWCGWACPQTVLLDGVYRRIEHLCEGTRTARMALDRAPWSTRKVLRKAAKHALYAVFTLAVAHTLVMLFGGAFIWTLIVALPIYIDMWWFREQTCLILCPYGRLQSALQDEDTFVVGYDVRRGEPRGKASATGASGDCVDCHRCVQVCPTGIDVREGVQMDCIGCTACIDACDDVMTKLHRPRGLIRLDSQRGLETGRRRFLRPRLFAYAAAAVLGLSVAASFSFGHAAFSANVHRVAGAPFVVRDGVVRNQLLVHVVSEASSVARLTLEATATLPTTVVVPQPTFELAPFESREVPVLLVAPAFPFTAGTTVTLRITDGDSVRELIVPVLGPSAR